MTYGVTRDEALDGMQELLAHSRICGPPTNMDFLAAISRSSEFKSGRTLTSFLNDFDFQPAAIDVISAGAYTLVQDLPGRPSVGKGIPHAGPMDPISFALGNMLVGNDRKYVHTILVLHSILESNKTHFRVSSIHFFFIRLTLSKLTILQS